MGIHARQDATQAGENQRIHEAPTVVANVEDQTLLANLREVLLDELVEAFVAHVGQINVAHAALGRGVHLLAIGLNHIEFAQFELVRDRLHLHRARTVVGRLRVDGQRDRLIGGVDEQLIKILRGPQRAAVDRQQVIAFLHLDPGLGQGRAQAGVPILPGVDLLDAIHAAGRVHFKVCPQQAHADGRDTGVIAATHIGVRVRKFTDHLPEDVGQTVAIGDVGQKRGVFVAYFWPIHTVHRSLIEVVALLTPYFLEHLFPLLGRIQFSPHAGKIERAIARLLLAVGLGIDDSVGVAVRTSLGFVEQLRTVEGDGKALHALDQGFTLAFLEVVHLDGGGLARNRTRQALDGRG